MAGAESMKEYVDAQPSGSKKYIECTGCSEKKISCPWVAIDRSENSQQVGVTEHSRYVAICRKGIGCSGFEK